MPISVRVQVAERQARIRRIAYSESMFDSDGARLAYLLRQLFGDKPFALDHDPALVNRKQRKVAIRRPDGRMKDIIVYTPPANHPDYLVYREAGPGSDHDIKTRVRGEHGQHSDLALARIAKRRARKHSGAHKSKIRSANRWPAKGTRKIQSRKFR